MKLENKYSNKLEFSEKDFKIEAKRPEEPKLKQSIKKKLFKDFKNSCLIVTEKFLNSKPNSGVRKESKNVFAVNSRTNMKSTKQR